jgi:hypothetical protein
MWPVSGTAVKDPIVFLQKALPNITKFWQFMIREKHMLHRPHAAATTHHRFVVEIDAGRTYQPVSNMTILWCVIIGTRDRDSFGMNAYQRVRQLSPGRKSFTVTPIVLPIDPFISVIRPPDRLARA